MRLYEINEMLLEAITIAENEAEQNDGEISENWYKFLDDLQIERDAKCLNVAKYIKGIKAESEAIKAEETNLRNRRKTIDNQIDRYKNYLKISVNEGEKLKDATTIISWRKSVSTNIIDAEKIPDDYCKIVRTPSATDIKKAIQSGINVNGAELKENQNIQIK